MKLKYFFLFLILNVSFFSFSQINETYEISKPSTEKKLYKRLGQVTKLENKNYLVIKRHQMLIGVYNQELEIISPKNKVLITKEIKNSLIITSKQIRNKTYLFSINNIGNLDVNEINTKTLNIDKKTITLTKLISRTGKSNKVRHFLIPEIIFSEDNSKFALIQKGKSKKDETLFLDIRIYNDEMELLYKKEIKTEIKRTDFVLKSAILTNDTNIFLAGIIDSKKIKLFSIDESNFSTYHKANENNESKIDFSDLEYINDKIGFFSFVIDKKSNLRTVNYISLDKNLKELGHNSILFNLLGVNKINEFSNYSSLEIKYKEKLSNDNTLIIAEYNNSDRRYFRGSLVLLIVNKDKTSCLYSRVISKKQNSSSPFTQGFIPFIKRNEIYLFFNEKGKRSNANYKVVKVDYKSDVVSEKIIFNTKNIGISPFTNTNELDATLGSNGISIYQTKSSLKVDDNTLILFTNDPKRRIKIQISD